MRNRQILFGITLLLANSLLHALQFSETAPVQIARNSDFSITPSYQSSGELHFRKCIGPSWVNVDSTTGVISGTTDHIAEAHYIQIAGADASGPAELTVILIVGNQRVFWAGRDGTPADFIGIMKIMEKGDVAIFPDGVYDPVNGNGGPYFRSGDSLNFTTLIAEHPGKATAPFINVISAQYMAFKGFKLGSFSAGGDKWGVATNHLKVMQCSAYAEGFHADAAYMLYEDCFAYGGDKSLFGGGEYVVFRRCVARHDYCLTTEPTATFMFYYGSDFLMQNCIVLDKAPIDNFMSSGKGFYYGAIETKWCGPLLVKDCIFLNHQDKLHIAVDGTQEGSMLYENCVIWDLVSGVDSREDGLTLRHCTFGDIPGDGTRAVFRGSSANYIHNNIFYKIGSASDTMPVISENFEATGNLFYDIASRRLGEDSPDPVTTVDPHIQYIVRRTAVGEQYDVGAHIQYRRGKSGTFWGMAGFDELTPEPLWPYPNEETIKREMAAFSKIDGAVGIDIDGNRGFADMSAKQLDGISSRTLTSYIWEYLGNPIPAEIYGDIPAATTQPLKPTRRIHPPLLRASASVIDYTLHTPGVVTLALYTASGRQVIPLVNRFHNPGAYRYDLKALKFPSGVYFATLTIDNTITGVCRILSF